MATPLTIGAETQRVLANMSPDPFVQVAILRVHHNVPGLLTLETQEALENAIGVDRMPLLREADKHPAPRDPFGRTDAP